MGGCEHGPTRHGATPAMTQPPDNRHRTPDHNDHDHDAGRRRLADAGSLPDVALAESVGPGRVDVADATPLVPINVWRITDVARPEALGRGVDLTPQLAVLLLGVFTRPADLVIDLADDVALAGAARAGSRRYLPVHDPTHLADLAGNATGTEHNGITQTNQLTGAARLAFLSWPLSARTGTTGTNLGAVALLAACRQTLSPPTAAPSSPWTTRMPRCPTSSVPIWCSGPRTTLGWATRNTSSSSPP